MDSHRSQVTGCTVIKRRRAIMAFSGIVSSLLIFLLFHRWGAICDGTDYVTLEPLENDTTSIPFFEENYSTVFEENDTTTSSLFEETDTTGISFFEEDTTSSSLLGEIEKPPGDSRDFRGLRLSNGMTVLLISDSKASKSFAALAVAAGAVNEPPDINGLAHLVEHALFLGNAKFPEEFSLTKFVKSNMGFCNGHIHKDVTGFELEVINSKLPETLHRFANMFISPLFSYSALEKATNDIESEYQGKVPDPFYQRSRIGELAANPKHPYHRFLLGSKNTLWTDPLSRGINISSACSQFFDQFYSANLMSLVVGGNYSLDALQTIVEEEFLPIQNRNASVEVTAEPIFSDKELKEWIVSEPPARFLELDLYFSVNDSLSQALKYATNLLESEHKGGLSYFLKQKRWAGGIEHMSLELPGENLILLQIHLTRIGAPNRDQVLCHIYEYLSEIRRWEPQEWYWNQIKDMADINWKSQKSGTTSLLEIRSLALTLGRLGKGIPVERALKHNKLFDEFNPGEIEDVFNIISNPANTKFGYVTRNLTTDEAPLTDPFYKIRYGMLPVTSILTDTLRNCSSNDAFAMPPKNEFIPSNFQLVSPLLNSSDEGNWDVPNLINTTSIMSKVWWWNARPKFPQPQLALTLIIRSPWANFDPLSRLCGLTFVSLVRKALAPTTQAAAEAGLMLEVYSMWIGIEVKISGYSDKAALLFDRILSTLLDPNITSEVNPQVLINTRNQQVKEENWNSQAGFLLRERMWDADKLIKVAEEVTKDNLLQWRTHFFDRIQLEWLFSGNIEPSEALKIAIKTELRFSETTGSRNILALQTIASSRDIFLEQGKEWLICKDADEMHSESATFILFQLGANWDPFIKVAAKLLELHEGDAFIDQIRVKKGLGYTAIVSVEELKSTRTFTLKVQGPRHPAYVETQIQAFIDSHLLQTSPEDFEKHKKTLREQLTSESFPTLLKQHDNFLRLIVTDRRDFDDQVQQLEVLDKITFTQFNEFLQINFNVTSKLKRQLSVYVISAVTQRTDSNVTEIKEVQELGDRKWSIEEDIIDEWKLEQPLHPSRSTKQM